MMPRILCAATLLLAAAALLAASPAARADSDPASLALADDVMKALGGQEAWDNTTYLSFDFVASRNDTVISRRSLAWDRATKKIHTSHKDAKGRAWEVWTDLEHKEGTVLVDGAPADPEAKKQGLDRAYAIWVNDTYWLLMPFKLKDPGVTLTDRGADSTGKAHVMELSFKGVGLTPGDRYRVHVDDESKLVTGWEMLLQGNKDGLWRPALWTEWKSVGDVKLAEKRHIVADRVVLTFENLKTARSAPEGALDPPSAR